MKYRTLSKRCMKWCRLMRLYGIKAKQSEERCGKSADRLRKLNQMARKIYFIYVDKYVNQYQSKGR